jgi:hypothetical protein
MKNVSISRYQRLKKHPRTRGPKLRGRNTYDKDKPPIIIIYRKKARKTIFSG